MSREDGLPCRHRATAGRMEPGFHCVRTQWIRGFMAFQLVRRIRAVLLMVLVRSEGNGCMVLTPSRARSGSCPCWQPYQDDADSGQDIDESYPVPVGQVPSQIRRRPRHRFRRVRNRAGSRRRPRHQSCPPGGCPDRGRRPFARCRRDQFVSGHVRASGRMLMVPGCNYSAPFRGHASRLSVG
jgi:hypothetical protein